MKTSLLISVILVACALSSQAQAACGVCSRTAALAKQEGRVSRMTDPEGLDIEASQMVSDSVDLANEVFTAPRLNLDDLRAVLILLPKVIPYDQEGMFLEMRDGFDHLYTAPNSDLKRSLNDLVREKTLSLEEARSILRHYLYPQDAEKLGKIDLPEGSKKVVDKVRKTRKKE